VGGGKEDAGMDQAGSGDGEGGAGGVSVGKVVVPGPSSLGVRLLVRAAFSPN
jgi:hypothetical protein